MCLIVTLGLGEIVLDRGERPDGYQPVGGLLHAARAVVARASGLHELRIEDPVVDLSILEIVNFTLPVVLDNFSDLHALRHRILNPDFLQETLGYTASKAGLVMAPRGFGTMFSMIILGTYARRGVDIRPLVGIGFILVAIAMWRMSGLNLASDVRRIVWPTVIQGVGTGLIFPGLSAAALSSMEKFKMRRAASLYSVTRNLGAAIGTSYLTTLLIHRQQINQSYLVEHITVFTLPHMQMPGGLNMGTEFAMGHKHGHGDALRDGAAAGGDAVVQRHLPGPDRADADPGADVPVPQARHAQPAGRSGALKKISVA